MYDRIKIYLYTYACLQYSTDTCGVTRCGRRAWSLSSSLSLLLLLSPSPSSSIEQGHFFFTCIGFSSPGINRLRTNASLFCCYFSIADLSFHFILFWTIKTATNFSFVLFLFIDYYYFNDDNTREIHTNAPLWLCVCVFVCLRSYSFVYLFELFGLWAQTHTMYAKCTRHKMCNACGY